MSCRKSPLCSNIKKQPGEHVQHSKRNTSGRRGERKEAKQFVQVFLKQQLEKEVQVSRDAAATPLWSLRTRQADALKGSSRQPAINNPGGGGLSFNLILNQSSAVSDAADVLPLKGAAGSVWRSAVIPARGLPLMSLLTTRRHEQRKHCIDFFFFLILKAIHAVTSPSLTLALQVIGSNEAVFMKAAMPPHPPLPLSPPRPSVSTAPVNTL